MSNEKVAVAIGLVKLWKAVRPVKLWKTVRPVKRAKRFFAKRVGNRDQLSVDSDINPSAQLTSEQIPEDVTMADEQDKESTVFVELLLMVLRHAMTAAGAGSFMTEDQMLQLAAALSTVAGLAWSAWRKWKRRRKAAA